MRSTSWARVPALTPSAVVSPQICRSCGVTALAENQSDIPSSSAIPSNASTRQRYLRLDAFRRAGGPLPPPWEELFGPLRQGGADGLVVVGQCGQSIDARIATPTGHSHYINGEAGLVHLHRLRALVDAVVVGVGTAIKDDPLLTVRRVEGPHPQHGFPFAIGHERA